MNGISLRTLVASFLGIVAGRLVWSFLDELLGLEASTREFAQGVA